MAEYYSTDYDKFLEEERKKLEKTQKKQQETINKVHDSESNALKEQYNIATDRASVAYEDDYERNAVQKLINERQIAEKNANLGLTNSGLNRTQQTAVQLSYANQKNQFDLARQATLDILSQNLAASLADVEKSRITSLDELNSSIEAQAQDNALSRYKTNVDANTKIYEAKQVAETTKSKGATLSEFNTIKKEIADLWADNSALTFWKRKSNNALRNNAAKKIYTYYMSGFINDLQAQELIRIYNLQDYIGNL